MGACIYRSIAGSFLSLMSASLIMMSGCKGIERTDTSDDVAAVPSQHGAKNDASGALLQSGAFQLGPGISCDLLHSQGDGLQGFPIK